MPPHPPPPWLLWGRESTPAAEDGPGVLLSGTWDTPLCVPDTCLLHAGVRTRERVGGDVHPVYWVKHTAERGEERR
jgi:hypothetical protein